MSLSTALVVPCYNERARLAPDRFLEFVSAFPDFRLLFVDDGSTDDTGTVLDSLCRHLPDRLSWIRLEANRGKAEAVRAGVLHALATPVDAVGFWDADLATPLEVAPAFADLLADRSELSVVMGARVQLLGRRIERRALRHYIGRAFATGASLALGIPVYDTQCGAKIFRAIPEVRQAFDRPFRTRWVFDVELLDRLEEAWGSDILRRVYEYPVPRWKDVGASSLRAIDGLVAARDILGIGLRRRRRIRKAART